VKAERYFDSISKKYDKGWGIENAPWVEWAQEITRKEVGKAENCLIVDLGTGTGNVILNLMKSAKNAEFIGVDISRGMLSEASEKFKSMDAKNVRLMVSRLDKLKLPENSVDFFVSGGAFHHIRDKERVLRNVFGMLKPGGKFINVDQFEPGKKYREESEKLRKTYPEKTKENDMAFRRFMKIFEQDKGHPIEFHTDPYEFKGMLEKTGLVECKVFVSLQPDFSVVVGRKPKIRHS